MKRLTFILILLTLLWPGIVQAQGPIYLPAVHIMATCEGTWSFIKPDPTTNEALNPSFETSGNYAAAGGATVARSSGNGKYGLRGLHVESNANTQGVTVTTATLANADHYVTVRVKGALPRSWAWSLNGATFHMPTLIQRLDAEWALYGYRFPAAEANGHTTLTIRQQGAGVGDYYLDGVQVEAKTYWTTYVDGSQDGCTWDGAANGSTSTRSGESRAGGRVMDFWDDYGFFVEEHVGTGAAPVKLSSRGYALLPGGELTGAKQESRQFTLVGKFIADSEPELHANRQRLIQDLGIESYAAQQAILLRYSGATVVKETAAHYEGGLEAQLKASYGPWQVDGDTAWHKLQKWQERATIRFFAPDPLWYEVGESAEELDIYDSTVFRYIAARLKATGQWDDLGLTTDPTLASPSSYVIAISPVTGDVFVGGHFEDWDGNIDWNYLVRYEPSTDTWYNVGAVGSFSAAVYALVFDPDGTLYIGGSFQNCGDPDGDYIVAWDGTNFIPLGTGMNSQVTSLTIGLDGTLYAGGLFTTAGGGAAIRIAQWDGDSWAAVGAGLNSDVRALATGKDGMIYVGGAFTDLQGGGLADANYIVGWNPDTAAYFALDTGTDNTVWTLSVQTNGKLYIGGDFTTAGGVTVNLITQWNGTTYEPMSGGVTTGVSVFGSDIGPDELLFIGGNFTEVGDILLVDRIARWNGAVWATLDVNFPGSPVAYDFDTGGYDPVIRAKYDLWVALSESGPGSIAGLVTADNEGTYPAYPQVIYVRSDGRLVTATLETLRNERTAKELLLNYGILGGETFVIDLTPPGKSAASSYFGFRPDAIFPNSAFGSWSLLPGDNDVSTFVNVETDEQNDNNNQLSGWNGVTGVSESNSDDGRIYVSIIADGGGFYHLEFYNDSARGAGDLVATTASYNAIGPQAVVEANNSGLDGWVNVDAVVAADADIYVDFPIVRGWLLWKDSFKSLD